MTNQTPGESRLFAQLRELHSAMDLAKVSYMLIGGFAVNIHGYVRATHDLDVMVLADDSDLLHDALRKLGYSAIDRRPDLACYFRGNDRLDVLYARRPISQRLLAQARHADLNGLSVPTISAEGLLGLKIQAFSDDPRRIRDLTDMMELVKVNRATMNLDEVRGYFRLFDNESILDDILKSTD
ncbi:nucleotidyltransferase domain-containing protein [Rudaea sp.]|uniref:nucleotidyltransferase domain-containing protein n=1 Tax=Rudaea sp. TaxID=2136325 RepID=UPI002ED59147